SCYQGIGLSLYQNSSVYRESFDNCAKLFNKSLKISLVDHVVDNGKDENLNNALVTQALIFSVEYALTQFWKSLGIVPDCVIGHSIGEYAAAVEAGILSLHDAVRMVALRAQIMQESNADGKMAGLLCNRQQAEAFCDGIDNVWIAAVNSSENVTISGRGNSVDKVIARAKEARVFTESLAIQHAFHSPLMADSAEQLAEGLSSIEFNQPRLPIYSSITGELIRRSDDMAANYWAKHLCKPVLFEDAFHRALQADTKYFIEIGGNATLTGLAAEMHNGQDNMFAPSLREGKDAWIQINESLIQYFKAGADINWDSYHEGSSAPFVSLPNTAFKRERFWFELNQKSTLSVASQTASNFNPVKDNKDEVKPMTNSKIVASNQQASSTLAEEVDLTEVVENILSLIAEVSGIDESELSQGVHLLSLGLDSLMLVRLGRSLVVQYGVEISLNELLKSLHSPLLIAEHLVSNMPEEKKAQLLPLESQQYKLPEINEQSYLQDAALVASNQSSTPLVASNSTSETIYGLMQNQLAVMQQQIQLLGGHEVQQESDSIKSVVEHPSSIQSNIAARYSTPNPEANDQIVRAAKPPQNIVWEEEELSWEQRTFIQNLAKDINQKSYTSKSYNSTYSVGLADWLIRAHFTPATKDMCHLIVAEESKGCRFKDLDGNEYIDTCMGFTVNLFGHSPEFVVKAVTEQLSKGMILGPQSSKVGEVAKMICELTGVERVAFTNSGTEAVMAALRVARSVSGRNKIVRFSTSYHGTFDGILARADEGGAAPLAN
ncbi:MAG: aminotransferase class III-fold pyridoxal phosphate-dependent enzyme, partial [Kangiellaceae bacterium]|nr:aminotransferase class III-fold pyridoxal phosphate-dependent enzyme [Kangiellaceae bacterium]